MRPCRHGQFEKVPRKLIIFIPLVGIYLCFFKRKAAVTERTSKKLTWFSFRIFHI